MNERLSRVLDYEKRLLEDRKQLQELIAESEREDSQIVKDKLEYFSQELAYMNRQVGLLRAGYRESMKREGTQMSSPVPPVVSPVVKPVTPPKEVSFSSTTIQTQPAPELQLKVNYAPVQEPQKKDFEKTIGKSLMGIFASVLIFISLILFATIMLPYFDDTAKMITTFVVSFAFVTVGLLKLRKNRENKFYMALTACGVGALYISLLLSNMYFKAVDDIALYVLIALWGIGVCFLCRIQATLFQIIGHIGVLISVILGCVLCGQTEDEIKFVVLIIYYFVTSIVFFATRPEREIGKNIIFHIFNALNYMIMVPVAYALSGDTSIVAYLLLFIFIAINLVLLFYSKTEKYGFSFAIFTSIYSWQIWGLLWLMLDLESEDPRAIFLYLLAMILLVAVEAKKIEGNIGKYIPQGLLICLLINSLAKVELLLDYGYIPLIVLPVLAIGYFRRNSFFKYSSLALVFLYALNSMENAGVHFLWAFSAVLVMYLLMYIKKEEYDAIFKYLLHSLFMFVWLVLFTEMLQELLYNIDIREDTGNIVFAITYTVLVAFNLTMMKSPLGYDLLTGEAENPAYHNIVNIILMIAGLIGISDGNNDFWHVLVILVTIVVFMVNAKNLLDNRNNLFGGIYVGFKFTTLMITILSSFDAVNYVISIACFIMAIISIIVGFRFQYKALRLFGLILSMISTFKLIMIDITYENTLGNAMSFFVSGILCFVISLIYNFIDGKIGKEK